MYFRAQQNSLLNNQLASQSKQIEELQESLKKELRQNSKESKETELKHLFEQEKKKLQAELLASKSNIQVVVYTTMPILIPVLLIQFWGILNGSAQYLGKPERQFKYKLNQLILES